MTIRDCEDNAPNDLVVPNPAKFEDEQADEEDAPSPADLEEANVDLIIREINETSCSPSSVLFLFPSFLSMMIFILTAPHICLALIMGYGSYSWLDLWLHLCLQDRKQIVAQPLCAKG